MALGIGIILIAKLVVLYSGFNTSIGFLAQKQDYISIDVWLWSFYIHVFTSIICLFCGLTQFSDYIVSQHRKTHRIIGYCYVISILFINFPSGMIMAIYANGGITSKIAFVALDSLWFWFTLKATLLAFKRKFKSHQKFMVRSYALTLSALTLRIWKQVLMRLTDLDEDTIYMIDAWLGFVPNMLIAEIYIYWKLSGNRNLTNHDKSE